MHITKQPMAVAFLARLTFWATFNCAIAFSPVSITSLPTVQTHKNRLHSSSVVIRDWQKGDGPSILNILQHVQPENTFNPEGQLRLDSISELLLEENYPAQDGCCFAVAENDGCIVGTAGLIVGNAIQYQVSGASQSSGEVTAAIRRCCCCLSVSEKSASNKNENVLRKLIAFLEKRAQKAQATQLIALAYPGASMQPTPALLESLGYQELVQQLPGVDAIQYGKLLSKPEEDSTSSLFQSSNSKESRLLSAVLSAGIVTALVGVLVFGVADLIGFDTTSPLFSSRSNEAAFNSGLGQPLSRQDLNQLLQDEKLERTTLDDAAYTKNREWKELSREEQREELALLKVITGKDIRSK